MVGSYAKEHSAPKTSFRDSFMVQVRPLLIGCLTYVDLTDWLSSPGIIV
jgi:hypothetical protein